MSDTAFGYLLLGIGIVFVLGIVYAITGHLTVSSARPNPPRGVHLPSPSALPVILALGAALLAAGLAFRAHNQLANPFLAVPGAIVFLYAVIAWVRAAGREWRETEHGSEHDAPGH